MKFPLSITIRNGSRKTLTKTEFRLRVTRPGYSDDIVQNYSASRFENDRIIAPGQGFSFCYSIPQLRMQSDPKALEYSIDYKYARFQR